MNLFLIPGKYPNLCSGVLTLKIEGKEYKFGHDNSGRNYDWQRGIYKDEEAAGVKNFDKFWSSGGGLDSDYCAFQKEWEIDFEKIPEQFRKYAAEIDAVFNEYVPHGCCGGCA